MCLRRISGDTSLPRQWLWFVLTTPLLNQLARSNYLCAWMFSIGSWLTCSSVSSHNFPHSHTIYIMLPIINSQEYITLKQRSVLLLTHLNKNWRGRNMATVLFIVTSKSIYSTINGCYVNSPTPMIFLLHMHWVVATLLCFSVMYSW